MRPGRRDAFPLDDARAADATVETDRRLCIRAGRRRRRARDSGRPGARRHHRARPFPLLDRRREGAAARAAARLRAQGHRAAVHRVADPRGSPAGRPRVGRFGRRFLVGLLPGARGHGGRACPAACRVAAGTRARTRAHRQSPRRPRRARQRRRVCLRPVAVHAAQGRLAARHRTSAGPALPARFRRPGRHERRSRRPTARRRSARRATTLEPEVRKLREIYDEHAGVRDRFVGDGHRRSGTGGAPRAHRARRARERTGVRPARRPAVRAVRVARGDEMRAATRATCSRGSRCASTSCWSRCAWSRRSCAGFRPATTRPSCTPPADGSSGIGLVEGWRGPVAVALEAGPDGGIRRCHPHDPSWNNWPVLEHAVIGNIVPDFPLINKSFNLSYSGQDL